MPFDYGVKLIQKFLISTVCLFESLTAMPSAQGQQAYPGQTTAANVEPQSRSVLFTIMFLFPLFAQNQERCGALK